jgi:hypothetical protein
MYWKVLSRAFMGACVLMAAAAGSTYAGKYHVYSCRTPSGESAPANGWSGSTMGAGTYAENTCPSGGALLAALADEPERTADTAEALWTLEVPTPETLTAATLWRAGDTAGGSAPGATWLSVTTRAARV